MLDGIMNPSPLSCIPRHNANVAAMSVPGYNTGAGVASRMNKNPHAVALGSMSSAAKARAAQRNGEKGGRPSGS